MIDFTPIIRCLAVIGYIGYFVFFVRLLARDQLSFGMFLVWIVPVPAGIAAFIELVKYLWRVNFLYYLSEYGYIIGCVGMFVLFGFGIFTFSQILGVGHDMYIKNKDVVKALSKALERGYGTPIEDKDGYVIGYKVMVEIDGELHSASRLTKYPNGWIKSDATPAEDNENGIYIAYTPDSPALDPYKLDAPDRVDPYYLAKLKAKGTTIFGTEAGRTEEAQIIKTERIDPKNPLKTNMKPPKGKPVVEQQKKKDFWKL